MMHVPTRTSHEIGLTNFSGLLNVESVGHPGKVWMHESHALGYSLLGWVSWIEVEFDPSIKTKG